MTRGKIQPISGMHDLLPEVAPGWQLVESTMRALLHAHAYDEIRVPLVENTELFKRAIGEYTDVVEKEMYSFVDQGGDPLTLRPEATAGIARALISNNMLRGARHKLWLIGAMFRHEKPQRGRFRQFYQIDVEAIGFHGPDVDIELIGLAAALWQALGISRVRLEINSLGNPDARRTYREALVAYFRAHEGELDGDSRRRLEGNPLRILDSKNPDLAALIAAAPLLPDYLDAESQQHFRQLRAGLDALGIAYTVNPRLVRGLDYYSRTVFEWLTDALGAQAAICSGGRYDGLIAQLGGEATPAIGFAMGIERIVELMGQSRTLPPAALSEVFVMAQGEAAEAAALRLAAALRHALPGRRIELNLGGGNFKAQFRRADKSGARLALLLGEDEMARGVVTMKPLRDSTAQSEVALAEAVPRVAAWLNS